MNAPQQQSIMVTPPVFDQVALIDTLATSLVQPDAVGEFPTPLDGALFMAGFNIPQIPLRGKAPFIKNWTEAASTDHGVIRAWSQEYPGCNFGSMAVRGSHFIFDADKPKDAGVPVVRERFQASGGVFTSKLIIESSPGKGHRYYRSVPGIGANISENTVKFADFSLRVNGEQCVSPGSVHPVTLRQYRVAVHFGLVAPTPSEIAFWLSERTNKTGVAELDDESIVHEGARDNTMASILGKARQVLGMDREELFTYGMSVNEKRFNPPLSDADIHRIANSIGRYEVKKNPTVLLGGVPAGQPAAADVEIPVIAQVPYPKFPSWVMKGTSVYDGFIEPICAVNTRFPEFMFMPAITLMLNYLALKVTIKSKPKLIPSIWMVAVGKKGRVIKSSCVNDTIEYLNSVGIIGQGNGARNAEGKSLIWTAGSTEGLGMEMARTNCKNAVLFYDELGVMTSKVKIEASSMAKHLMTMYESGQFSNTIKARKENFDFPPGSYCASIIACNAEKTFLSNMGPILKAGEGMDERWFYLYQPDPKTWPVNKDYVFVNTVAGAQETKKRIDKAVQQGVFEIEDFFGLLDKMAAVNNRMGVRVAKLALYFAVDLGKTEIDDDCLERAAAVAQYDLAVKHYLQVPEGATMEGQLQSEIINFLVRNAGRVTHTELNRRMHPERYGTSL
jgi:hypothetical protein